MRTRVTTQGLVTIPADLRLRAGLLPGCEVDVWLEGDVVTVALKRRGERVIANTGDRGNQKAMAKKFVSAGRGSRRSAR